MAAPPIPRPPGDQYPPLSEARSSGMDEILETVQAAFLLPPKDHLCENEHESTQEAS